MLYEKEFKIIGMEKIARKKKDIKKVHSVTVGAILAIGMTPVRCYRLQNYFQFLSLLHHKSKWSI